MASRRTWADGSLFIFLQWECEIEAVFEPGVGFLY